ncbi:MAG: choice-of-anchor D domain-containing protein [Acidimicrobiia bacterium]
MLRIGVLRRFVAVLSAFSALVSGLALIESTVTAVPAAAAGAPSVSATLNQYSFPNWYEDSTGTRVEPCLDPNDAHCIVLANPGVFDPVQPTSFPTNFPDEFFYSVVDSDLLTTPGCAGAADPLAANPGKAFVRMALEGAFANDLPAFGEQMVFGRVRIVARGGLCPGQVYTVQHPYGTFTFTANSAGGTVNTIGTSDIGCVPVAPATCDFTQALASPVLTQGLLRWDSGADPGYLGGDPAVPHTITGGLVNSVTFSGAGLPVGGLTTNLFTVMGKIAGPLAPSVGKVDFGGIQMGQTSAPSTFNLTNIAKLDDAGIPVTVTGVSFNGANAGDFAVVNNGCAALGLDTSCTVAVSFTPTNTGPRTGNIVVSYAGGANSPLLIPIQGSGLNPGASPAMSISVPDGSVPPALDFGPVRIGSRSDFQTVTVTNTGTAPLQVQSLTFTNAGPNNDAPAFSTGNDACTNFFVPVGPTGNTCTFGVAFQPTNTRTYNANLIITANTPSGPVQITLTAQGWGGIAAVSATTSASNNFPDWYQDEAGMRVGQCIDPNDPMCIVLPDDFYTGGALIQLPSFANFPEEFFYFVADSDIINTPGCGTSAPGKAFVRMATEAAFGGASGGPIDGDQIVFGRVRFSVTSGLCANTEYKFTFPYGQVKLKTDSNGSIRRNAATTDIGCFPVAPATCDYTAALQSPVLGGFIRQINAPAGYLGDPNLPAPVTGAPYIAPGEVSPVDYFRIEPAAGGPVIGQTNLFTVMGKLAGPVVASPSSLSFGGVATTTPVTTSAPQTITFTNDGTAPVTTPANAVSVTGADIADFVVLSENCSSQTLSPVSGGSGTSSCSVTVQFGPRSNGPRSAEVRLTHSGANSPTPAPVSGIGLAAVGFPAISVHPTTLTFADLHTGQVSASESVKVSNVGGGAPLVVGVPTFSGLNPGAFQVTRNDCTVAVPVDGECRIEVAFTPNAAGVLTASLDIPNNSAAPTSTVSVGLSGRGSNAVTVTSPVNDAAGFPTYYGDDNGVRLEPCVAATDPNCIVLADPTFDPAQPQVFPTNFPMEFFYNIADSNLLSFNSACGAATVTLRMALEGTFTSAAPQSGAQTTFARWRVIAKGLCANTTYLFDSPWGTVSLTTNGAGDIPANQGVINFGPVGTDPRLVGGPLATGFLRWDPNAGAPAPAGYLGDGRTFQPIVGSRYIPAGETTPINYLKVRNADGSNIPGARMDDFMVSGKIAGPIMSDRSSVAFGSQAVGTPTAAQSVVVTNLGNDGISAFGVALGGPDAAQFAIAGTSNCLVATLLTLDQTCHVDVVFSPQAATPVGDKSATLTVSYGGLRSPVTVALTGTATPAAVPQIAVQQSSVVYNPQEVATTSAPQTVNISNTGGGPLSITDAVLGGANSGDFIRVNNCPAAPATLAAPPAANTCTVSVSFRPTATGTRTATLTISSNDPVKPTVVVTLTGTATAAVASVTPTTLSFSTKGTSTQTTKITNTGTANLNVVGAPALVFGGANPLKYTATHDCNNVAPGKNCTVKVTFNPGAGPANEALNATLTISTNASNASLGLLPGRFLVTLNGVRK